MLSSRDRVVSSFAMNLPESRKPHSRPLSEVRKQEQVQTCQQRPKVHKCCSGGYKVPCSCGGNFPSIWLRSRLRDLHGSSVLFALSASFSRPHLVHPCHEVALDRVERWGRCGELARHTRRSHCRLSILSESLARNWRGWYRAVAESAEVEEPRAVEELHPSLVSLYHFRSFLGGRISSARRRAHKDDITSSLLIYYRTDQPQSQFLVGLGCVKVGVYL